MCVNCVPPFSSCPCIYCVAILSNCLPTAVLFISIIIVLSLYLLSSSLDIQTHTRTLSILCSNNNNWLIITYYCNYEKVVVVVIVLLNIEWSERQIIKSSFSSSPYSQCLFPFWFPCTVSNALHLIFLKEIINSCKRLLQFLRRGYKQCSRPS